MKIIITNPGRVTMTSTNSGVVSISKKLDEMDVKFLTSDIQNFLMSKGITADIEV